MKRKFYILNLLVIMSLGLVAQDYYWEFDDGLYANNMTVTSVICIDGVEQTTEQLEIGAFCGSEVRGCTKLMYTGGLDRYIAFLTIYGGSDTKVEETFTFRLYDHAIGQELELECSQTLSFVANDTHGEPQDPFVFEFTTPVPAVVFDGNGSWDDTSNWQNETLPTEEDDVVIDGNATISGEVIINALSINEGKSLTIQNGGVLTVVGEFTNTDYDALIIEDGGQIIQTNENVAATFKKNIVNPESWTNPVTGWQFISSPMVDAAIANFAPANGDYDLYRFDGSADYQWVNYKYHDDFEETFTQGIGYIASYETQDVASFKGNLNNETEYFDFNIAFDSNNDWANFYLLGNPFSFDIDWELMDAYRIEDGFATVDANSGAYIYNVEGNIKVGEGFMICASRKNAALEYIASANSRKTKSDYINIVVSNSIGSDNVIINFSENESESTGFPKLDNINPNIAAVYVKDNNTRYGIFNYDSNVKEIPLYFDAKEMCNYTINVIPNGKFENVILVDRFTGIETNMLIEDYTFTSTTNDDSNRFFIRLTDGLQTSENTNFAYLLGEELIIETEGSIQIIDMMGRVVMTEENHNGNINISNLKNAAYIVRCVNENEVRTQKIVVL